MEWCTKKKKLPEYYKLIFFLTLKSCKNLNTNTRVPTAI